LLREWQQLLSLASLGGAQAKGAGILFAHGLAVLTSLVFAIRESLRLPGDRTDVSRSD